MSDSEVKLTDDRRVIAGAGLALNRATVHSLEEALAREQVVEPPANIALAHVPPWRPPREHLIVLRLEGPADVHEAVADDTFELRTLLRELPDRARFALFRMNIYISPGNIQIAADQNRVRCSPRVGSKLFERIKETQFGGEVLPAVRH